MIGLKELLIFLFFVGGEVVPAHADTTPLQPSTEEPLEFLDCRGQAKQGGLILCNGLPGTQVKVSGPNGEHARTIPIGETGRVAIGLRRDESALLTLAIQDSTLSMKAPIEPREDPFRTIEGLDCDKVDARTQAQKDHAGRSWVKKQAAFKTFHDGPGASTGFLRPAEGPASSPFGPARKYIGVGHDGQPCERTSIHRGYDIAIPTGTDIIAPAAGTVTLGDPDLYYEGGTVFLDHGDGLVSVFMHMSDVDVSAGDQVQAGERLGASGNTGRTTGPHLHWAVKWRNTGTENRSGDFYIDPALLMELPRDG